MEQLTTEDLAGGGKFTVETFYGVKYVVENNGIAVVDPFKGSSEFPNIHKADKVEIASCQLGGWLKAILCVNGAKKPFSSNCIAITDIKPA